MHIFKRKRKKTGARPTHNLALSVIQISLVLQKNKKNKTNQNFVGGIHFNQHHPLVSEPEKMMKSLSKIETK